MNRPTSELNAATERPPAESSGPRRWLRWVAALIVATLIVGYLLYMSLGMPGMNHS